MKSRGKGGWRLRCRGAAVLRGRFRESLAVSNPFCRHVRVKPGCLAHNHPCWSGRRLTVLDFVKCSPQIVVDGVTPALGPGAVEQRVTLSLRWFRRLRWHLRFPGLPGRFCNTSSLVRLRNFWHPVRMPDCSFFWVNRGWTDYKIAHCWWAFLLSQLTLHFILKHCCFVLGGLGGDAHLGLVLKDVTSMSARPSPSRLPLYSHCMQ